MRVPVAVAAVLAVAVSVVAIGRWDANHDVRAERRGMAAVFTEAARVRIPDGWRITAQFRCLLYRFGPNPFALELCFDARGGLVESVDRRSGSPEVFSLRFQPSEAAIHVKPDALTEVLTQMGAYKAGVPRDAAFRYPLLGSSEPPPRIPPGSGLPSART